MVQNGAADRQDDSGHLGPAADADAATDADPAADAESIRRVSRQIEGLPLEGRRYIAAYSYVLARVAHTDRVVSEEERRYMERAVVEAGHLTEPQAALVVQMAKSMTVLFGSSEDYVMTREFAKSTSHRQREDLLRTAFVVGAADGGISAAESAELGEIGAELGLTPDQVDSIRREVEDRSGGT